MKNYFKIILSAIILAVVFSACGEKYETPTIDGLVVYTDSLSMMSVKLPKNWQQIPAPGKRVISIPNKGLLQSYTDYNTESVPGAVIRVHLYKLDSAKTVASIVDKHRQSLMNVKTQKEKKIIIDGVEGTEFTYNFPLTKGEVNGIRIIAAKDSGTATEISIDCFGGAYETYKAQIAEVIKSLKLGMTIAPKPADTTKVAAEPPTMKLVTKSGNGFTIGIPDNFYPENANAIKNAIGTYNYAGDRRGDCNIRIDVLDGAKVVNLKNTVDKNKAAYQGKEPSKTTLGGKDAYRFDYSPAKGINSRVWYVLSNKKVFIVTMNYFVGEKDMFLPPFEKSINSIKFN
ncbi:MAG: hypothetical protein WCR42_12720 [bacterium]